MRNLILFIWKYHFFLLFLLLEIFSFSLLVHKNNFHHSSILGSMNEVSGNMINAVNDIKEYFELKGINEALAKENAKLQSISRDAFLKIENNTIFINDTAYLQQYQFLGAKVINSTINKRNNYLILNKGFSDGIEADMGVIGHDGVVGIVKDVSKNYCSVISVLHKNTSISAKFKKNQYFGLLEWNGEDIEYAILKDISKHVQITIGDTIVTRGSSAIFPSNTMIGTVADFLLEQGEDFYVIKVKLSTDFRNISYVYVISNLLKEEQLELENKFND